MAKRTPKTQVVCVVQGNYGYGHGWEDLVAETSVTECRARLREYRENEPGTPFRRVNKRVPRTLSGLRRKRRR